MSITKSVITGAGVAIIDSMYYGDRQREAVRDGAISGAITLVAGYFGTTADALLGFLPPILTNLSEDIFASLLYAAFNSFVEQSSPSNSGIGHFVTYFIASQVGSMVAGQVNIATTLSSAGGELFTYEGDSTM